MSEGDFTVSLAQQIASAKRELALRKSVYPKWVRDHRMQLASANYEIAAMAAIIETLEGLEK